MRATPRPRRRRGRGGGRRRGAPEGPLAGAVGAATLPLTSNAGENALAWEKSFWSSPTKRTQGWLAPHTGCQFACSPRTCVGQCVDGVGGLAEAAVGVDDSGVRLDRVLVTGAEAGGKIGHRSSGIGALEDDHPGVGGESGLGPTDTAPMPGEFPNVLLD